MILSFLKHRPKAKAIKNNMYLPWLELDIKVPTKNILTEFENVKDSSINGNKLRTNKLLSTTVFETEKIALYLTIINQRLNKLKEIVKMAKIAGLSNAIDKIRPPIFWKDKKKFSDQAHLWNFEKLNTAITKTYNAEVAIKSYSEINKNLLIKKLLLDICLLANV